MDVLAIWGECVGRAERSEFKELMSVELYALLPLKRTSNLWKMKENREINTLPDHWFHYRKDGYIWE